MVEHNAACRLDRPVGIGVAAFLRALGARWGMARRRRVAAATNGRIPGRSTYRASGRGSKRAGLASRNGVSDSYITPMADPPIANLAATLKARRREERLSLRDLSDQTGVSLNALSRV